MTTEVSVNLFDIEWDDRRSPRLANTLSDFAALPLQARWRDDIRLEHYLPEQVSGRNVLLLDFAKRREVGPGRLATGEPLTAVELQHHEDFGEETAALYVPARKVLLVLHNQAGVGAGRMMRYLNALDPGNGDRHFDYAARPRLDAVAMERYRGMRHISKVIVTATVQGLEAANADAGAALAQVTRAVNARRIKIELNANELYQRGSFLDMPLVRQFVRGLQGQDDEVSDLQVKGIVDGEDQLIDLLEHKMRRKYRADELQVLQHRYTLESRWLLLRRALRSWIDVL